MSTQEIAIELQYYLRMYSIGQEEKYLNGILSYAGMLAGRVTE